MTARRHGADYFDIISFVGSSQNSKIYNVRHKDTGEPLTMHVIPKPKEGAVQNSSLIVETFRIPYAVCLRYTFETKSRHYAILDSVKPERQLCRFFEAYGPFTFNDATFIMAEILISVTQFHAYYMTYKQLNLENVSLDITGHVKLKRDLSVEESWVENECISCRQNGTCSYHKEAAIGQEAVAKDWLDVGILLCFLLTGKVPGSLDERETETRGVQSLSLPPNLPEAAVGLTRILLSWRKAPFTPLQIQEHAFFSNINWQKARKRQLTPPEIFIKTPPKIPSKSPSAFHISSNDRSAAVKLISKGKSAQGFEHISHEESFSQRSKKLLEADDSIQEYLKRYSESDKESLTSRSRIDENNNEEKGLLTADGIVAPKHDSVSASSEKLARARFQQARDSNDDVHLNDSYSSKDFHRETYKAGYLNWTAAEKDDHCPDNVSFVTAESLEKAYLEQKNQSKKGQIAESGKTDLEGMSAKSMTDSLNQDWPCSNVIYSSYQNQQTIPTYNSVYRNLGESYGTDKQRNTQAPRGFESSGLGFISKDQVGKRDYPPYSLQQHQTDFQFDKSFESRNDVIPYSLRNANDMPKQNVSVSKDVSGFPMLIRSRSYHGGFSDDVTDKSAYRTPESCHTSPLERANELLFSNFGEWRVRAVDDSFVHKNPGGSDTNFLTQTGPEGENTIAAYQNGNSNDNTPLKRRVSRSLVNINANVVGNHHSGLHMRQLTNVKPSLPLESFEATKGNHQLSRNGDEDDMFIKEYLTQSLPLQERVENEDDILKRTWPVGPSLFRGSKTKPIDAGRRNVSLMQKISDHDALQKIREGAYLQGKKNFSLPQRQNLTSSNSDAAERVSKKLEERQHGIRNSRSFDEGYGAIYEEALDTHDSSYVFSRDSPGRPTGYYGENENGTVRQQTLNSSLESNQMDYSKTRPSHAQIAWSHDPNAIQFGIDEDQTNGLATRQRGNHEYSQENGSSYLSSRDLYSRAELNSKPSKDFLEANGPPYSANGSATKSPQLDNECSYDSKAKGLEGKLVHYRDVQSSSRIETKRTDQIINPKDEKTGDRNVNLRMETMEEEIIQTEADDDLFLENNDYVRNVLKEPLGEKKGRDQRTYDGSLQKKDSDPSCKAAVTLAKKSHDGTKNRDTELQKSGENRRSRIKKSRSSGETKETGKEQELDNDDKMRRRKLRKMADLRKAKKIDKNDRRGDKTYEGDTGSNAKENVPKDEPTCNNNDNEITEASQSCCENVIVVDKKDDSDVESAKKKNSRSVSFHETTKNQNNPSKTPVHRKSKSTGAVDLRRPKLSLNKSSKEGDMKIELLPNPKSHRTAKNGHRRLKSVEEQMSLAEEDQIKTDERKCSLDSKMARIQNDGLGVTDLVDRLRVISEASRSTRSSPTVERRYSLNPNVKIDRTNSVRNILKPKITIENSTPPSSSSSSICSERNQIRKDSFERNVSRESSIGSASDLWIDEEVISGRKGARCRRSLSAASGRSAESVELFRAKYAKSPTLTSNSSEDDINLPQDQDRQSYISGRSIDSGLSDIFETSKEEMTCLTVSEASTTDPSRPRCNVVSKSDSGVMKDINEAHTSQSDDVFEDPDPSESSKGSESLCHHCRNGFQGDSESQSEESQQICSKCHTKKVERKEAIVELIQTEINYGQDLRILKEEFYAPVKNGGILSTENVNGVFLNLQELIDVNSKLCITLQDDLEECITRNDQELESLEVGRVFLENVEFFQAYEVFCSKQGQAADLVENLQKKSELLRIFLQVSCKQNSKLRKMDLKSFLTMPVQRIMKYPLLLTRIYRATPRGNSDREALIHARRKIEEQIMRINEIAAGRPSKLRKSKSTSALNQSESKGNQLTKLVAEILDWRLEETQIILSDPLEVSCCELINVSNWSRKSMKKPCKVQVILCAYGVIEHSQALTEKVDDQFGSEPRGKSEATNAAVVILRRKSANRYSLYKDPILLGQAVISRREDIKIAFEILPIFKEPLTLMTDEQFCCQKWLRHLNYYSKDLGLWRTRRNAMANIMIQSMS